MWDGHVEDVGDSTGTDYVVVVEKVTTFGIRVHGHVLLGTRQRPTVSDRTKERSESR